ncbi:MAG: choice-of-anchor D domain-containing protein, partial [Acidobacteriota bacterium]|nr:choice-of-anchor D domain-containing protein [Acidobacteriota bacterium]
DPLRGVSDASGFTAEQGPLTKGIRAQSPDAVAVDAKGDVYFADVASETIERIDSETGQLVVVAGIGAPGPSGDHLAAEQASLDTPVSLVIDSAGNIYIADQGNHVVRRIDASTKTITTVAGYGEAVPADGTSTIGPSNRVTCQPTPSGLAVDSAGNLYISDRCDGTVRSIDPSGRVSIVAGGGNEPGVDGLGDGQLAIQASLDSPSGIALSPRGDLYIADTGNNLVRVVHAKSHLITVLAGNGQAGYSGDISPAGKAVLNHPSGIRLDAAGDVFIVDSGNAAIREVEVGTGLIKTIASSPGMLDKPLDIALDGGNIYLADIGNHTLRQIGFEIASYAEFERASHTDGLSIVNTGNRSFQTGTKSLNLEAVSGAAALQDDQSRILTLQPNSLQFTARAIDEQSIPQSFMVSNRSVRPIAVSAVSITGQDAKDFHISSTCEALLAPATSCEVSVFFLPHDNGTRNASINIHSGLTYVLPLTGSTDASLR